MTSVPGLKAIASRHHPPDGQLQIKRASMLGKSLELASATLARQVHEYRLEIHQQSLALEQHQRDMGELNASLNDSLRILTAHAPAIGDASL